MSLLPGDVPGAVLQDNVSLEDHSVLELKRWLECRGLKKQGTKEELIKRIHNCIQAGNESKIFLGIDGGKWYDAKRNLQPIQPGTSNAYDQCTSDDIFWDNFPSSTIPQFFNKGHIYTYIIGENIENEDPEVEVTEDKTYTTVKPFRRGHQYVSSQHISEVQDGCSGNAYVCKCKCLSSFQKAIKYNVRVMLNKTSGAIMKGICECKQSSLGKCSHVTALLLFIWEHVQKFGYAKIVGTSKPREWGLGTQKRSPGAIKEKSYPIKKYKMTQRSIFDPRPATYLRNPDLNQFISDLQKTGNNPMFLSIFKLKYEDFQYDEDELSIIKLQDCKQHDIAYSQNTSLEERHKADLVLENAAWERVRSRDAKFGERAAALVVTSGIKKSKRDDAEAGATHFDNTSIVSIRLALNGEYWPNERMQLDFAKQDYTLAYYNYTRFYSSYSHSTEVHPILDYGEFKQHALFVIDCSRQEETMKSSTVDIKLEIEADKGFPADTKAYCIIVHDCLLEYFPLTEVVRTLI
ncbi:unnamed protein product [Phaedon cochleariae]|uniref:SAP domain-containing protein n=1 Tax=Phaedon cochleariae TaxID=80249 RepID=A0A9N9S9C8_PHACE|nr:unnamed protein product [Phaedon cochleariae]